MRIGIDISPMVLRAAGIGRYTEALWAVLDALPAHSLHGVSTERRDCPLPVALQDSVASLRRSPRVWRAQAAASHVLRTPLSAPPWVDMDVCFFPDTVFPRIVVPSIVTLHDLSFALFPQFHTTANRLSLLFFLERAARDATHIVCDSLSTQRDLLRLYGDQLAPRTTVIYPCIDDLFGRDVPLAERRAVLERYSLDEQAFVLGVGTLEPRKNMRTLIGAYRELAAMRGSAPPLVIVGKGGWLGETDRLAALVGPADVRFVGYVSDADLAALYQTCLAFLYPSYAEGFGLPVAEAMSAGAPVLCSETTSLPEVAGTAALYVNPHRQSDLAHALARLLDDATLRAEMSAAGPAQAARFSRQRFSAEVIALCDRVMASYGKR